MKFSIIQLAAALGFAVPSFAVTAAYLGDSSGSSGTSITVPVQFITDEKIVGVQFDIKSQGGGATVTGVIDGLDYQLSDHLLATRLQADGSLRVLLSSRSGSEFFSGNLARIAVDLAGNVPPNRRAIGLSNVFFATDEGMKAALEVAPHVAVTAPAAGTKSDPGVEISITAEAADTTVGGLITNVAFFANGVSIGSDGVAPFTTAWTPSDAGNYALTAVATNNLGETRTSPPMPVLIGVANGFEGWRLANFDASQLADSSVSGIVADPESDGLPNLAEYAFVGSPLEFDWIKSKTVPLINFATGETYYSYSYQRPVFATDLNVLIQESEELDIWQNSPSSVIELLVVPEGEVEKVTIFDTVPVSASGVRKFFRVRAELE